MATRFTVQVLGVVDGTDFATVQNKIFEALESIKGFRVTTCNLTGWQNSEGRLRQFDENGIEVPVVVAGSEEVNAAKVASTLEEVRL